jgi:hypothetical protein
MALGLIIAYFSNDPPPQPVPPEMEEWMLCKGQPLQQSDYPDLFNLLGSRFGRDAGAKSFNLPSLCGYFIRGLDLDQDNKPANQDPDVYTRTPPKGEIPPPSPDVPGVQTLLGSTQSSQTGTHEHDLTGYLGNVWGDDKNVSSTENPSDPYGDVSTVGGTDTYPKNVYVNYIMRVK